MRALVVEEPVALEPHAAQAAFRAEPDAWLPVPSCPSTDGSGWRVYLWAGPVGMLVPTAIARPHREADGLWRVVRFEPEPAGVGRLAPSFSGDLGVRTTPAGVAVALRGHYRPPAGIAGSVADRLVASRLARATARRLVASVARRLEDRDRVEQRPAAPDHPALSTPTPRKP